jgi:hypothetical protein
MRTQMHVRTAELALHRKQMQKTEKKQQAPQLAAYVGAL